MFPHPQPRSPPLLSFGEQLQNTTCTHTYFRWMKPAKLREFIGMVNYHRILPHCAVWKPTSALFGSPTASDFNLRQHRTSDSVRLQPLTASDLNLRQHRSSDNVGLQPPTASDLRQRRTSSPTASEFYFRRMVVCAGSLTITFDPTSGQRSYSNLEKFHEVFWGTKLQGKG